MKINLDYNDCLHIETNKEKLVVTTAHSSHMILKGHSKYKSIDDIEFEDELKKLEKKFIEINNRNKWDTKEIPKIIERIKNYIDSLHKHLHFDKCTILHALERNRDYCYSNYYSDQNFYSIREVEDLKKEIQNLNGQIFKLERTVDDEVTRLRKKITELQGLKIEKKEVEGYLNFDMDLRVNCPFCDSYEDVELYDYEGGSYEINHECGGCGKIFSVKAER